MHNSFTATPVFNTASLNTFRGQAGQSMWESRGEVAHLSTGHGLALVSLWENLWFYTPQTRSGYTVLPTGIFTLTNLFGARFSTLSTGPIKRVTNVRKEFRS